MQLPNIILQPRDRQILDLLRDQGFASFDQINSRFFNSRWATERLDLLVKNNFLVRKTLAEWFQSSMPKGYFPYILGTNLSPKMKIYALSPYYRKQLSETNRIIKIDLILHQIMLNDIRFFLEDKLPESHFFLSDPQIKILSDMKSGRPFEMTPDISIEHPDFTMAVELERTVKSVGRYASRFSFYRNSIYNPVLYVYVKEESLDQMKKFAGIHRRFGFAHYLRPNMILTKAWGYLPFLEWIEKIKSIA